MWWNKLPDDITKSRAFLEQYINLFCVGDYNFPCKCKLYSVHVCCSYMVCSCVLVLLFVISILCMCVCTYVCVYVRMYVRMYVCISYVYYVAVCMCCSSAEEWLLLSTGV